MQAMLHSKAGVSYSVTLNPSNEQYLVIFRYLSVIKSYIIYWTVEHLVNDTSSDHKQSSIFPKYHTFIIAQLK